MSAIGVGLGYFIRALTNPAPAGSGSVNPDELNSILGNVVDALQIIKDTFDAGDNASNEMVTAATDAAQQIETIGQNLKDITEHTYGVVIPNSLSWTIGYVVSHLIDPLRRSIAILNLEVAKLEQWEAEIKVWRARWVDPQLALWVGFRQWFDEWPRGVLFTVHDWLQHPNVFAQWAAPPLIGPLVSYLAGQPHKQSRDALALIMVNAWSEEPIRVLDAIEMWLRH